MASTLFGPVLIDNIHSSGKGIALYEGKKYYVSFSIPGEQYLLQKENRRLGFRTAKIIDIIEKSPSRTTPICEYFGKCGGCNFMHIEYHAQLILKKRLIQQALEKYNINYTIKDIVEAEPALNYRNKATFSVQYTEDTVYVGFHPEFKSNYILNIDYCYLLHPLINNVIKDIQAVIQQTYFTYKVPSLKTFTLRTHQNQIMIILNVNDISQRPLNVMIEKLKNLNIQSIYYEYEGQLYHVEETLPWLFELISGKTFRISPLTFFQNHLNVTEQMVQFIKTYFDFSIKVVFDLYSGNGSLSLSLMPDHSCLYAIEGNSYAINDANYNSRNNNQHHHIMGDVLETFTLDFIKNLPRPDVIILDPPRSGTLIEIIKTIIASQCPLIIYVSCNPLSLSWNLQQLCEYYTIIDMTAFDMFPQTHQVETVVILQRKI